MAEQKNDETGAYDIIVTSQAGAFILGDSAMDEIYGGAGKDVVISFSDVTVTLLDTDSALLSDADFIFQGWPPQANRSCASSSASIRTSTSALVLYIAKDARQVAWRPRCSISGPVQC